MPEKLDEAALRRPDFVEGVRVVLADSQSWSLRTPVVWFVPHDASPSGFRSCTLLGPGDRFQDLLDARSAAMAKPEAAAAAEIIGAELALGRELLLANYRLTPDQVAQVLRFGYDADSNPEGRRIRDEVMDVVLGMGPKPQPDGTDASPMPSGVSPGETA
jgi:hypothetical protein